MLNEHSLKFYNPFNHLGLSEIREYLDKVTLERFEKGTILLKRGKDFDCHYYLVSGEVDLIDNQYTIKTVEAGSHRARNPLNLDMPTTESLRAKTDIAVFSFPIDFHDAKEESERVEQSAVVNLSPAVTYPHAVPDVAVDVEDLSNESDDWMSCLLTLPLFNKLTSRQVHALFKQFETLEVDAGTQVIKEGSVGRFFYVLASGTARVTNREGCLDKILSVGQYFGEESIISESPCNASVVMTSDGVLKRLEPEAFVELLQKPILNYIEEPHLKHETRPYQLLDVKMPIEFKLKHLPGSMNIPLSKLRSSIDELTNEKLYVVPDDAGRRADIAVHLLCQAGLEAVILKDVANL